MPCRSNCGSPRCTAIQIVVGLDRLAPPPWKKGSCDDGSQNLDAKRHDCHRNRDPESSVRSKLVFAKPCPLCNFSRAMSDVTMILRASERTSEELLSLVYDDLRRLAAARMAQEAAGQTLQATALVHEAWLQLSAAGDRSWQNRGHFFGAAADAMRRILVDNARRKARQKRGGGCQRVDIGEVEIAQAVPDEDLLLINEALEKLEREDPEQARIVVMKFFGGLTNEEVAETLGIGERTVYRQWVCAKARLFRWVRPPE